MKTKTKLICALLCIALVVGVAYAAAGSENDPLITLSYLTDVFKPQVTAEMETMVEEKSTELTTRFDELIGSFELKEDESGEAEGGESVEVQPSVFEVITLSKGQILTGDIGCEIMLRVGTAQCVSSGSTGLIDVTEAGVLADGDSLVKNHLYMVTINTRTVEATANTVKVLVRGDYTIE